jgi:phosphotransferase system HPr-like phosphotransfer protein
LIGYVRLKMSDVDFFCRDINTFQSDINAGEGNRVVDPKSLLSIMTLDLSKPVKLEIFTDDDYEKERFREVLNKYMCYGEDCR